MSGPSVARARDWQPAELRRLADSWDGTARLLHSHLAIAARATRATDGTWVGSAGDAARADGGTVTAAGQTVARALVLAAVAARDGADQIDIARLGVLRGVQAAHGEGFLVADDGSVTPGSPPPELLIPLPGNEPGVATQILAIRAGEHAGRIAAALQRLADADEDAANDIRDAFELAGRRVDPALGNASGTPWAVRIEANRTHLAQAVVDRMGEGPADPQSTFYRGLLSEIDDPAGSGRRVDRKIIAFDPDRETLVELNGDLDVATSVAVLVPGMNTTIEGSAADTARARRFVAATRGGVAAITYLGGPFPQADTVVGALLEAASPRFALDMAPRLVAFGRDVDAAVDATGRAIPVTYVGHSYGGSILGTAEALGLSADRTVYVAAAGAGVGVDGPGDWHDGNPHVLRFSLTAPADPIQLVQGIPGGPHGADPDEMTGVIPLATGHYDDGRLMAGPRAHTDVIDVEASDAWRNVLAVITGDREHIRVAS